MRDVMSMYRSGASARVLLRLPRGLHEQLKRAAADEGVSTNTLMTTLLASALGYTPEIRMREGHSMDLQSSRASMNAEAFARAIGANGRTFRRWLRKRGEGVGQGAEYDLPAPDSPDGKRLAAEFRAR